jgi:LmbE family N-acetylglucosaminyl deacetylase
LPIIGEGDSGVDNAVSNDVAEKNGDARSMDVYLQPHSDDICFSLGALAYRRRKGLLLTVFPRTNYVAPERQSEYPTKDIVTAARLGEDAEFARACGLATYTLDGEDALTCGIGPWNLEWVEERTVSVMAPLLEAILRTTSPQTGGERPWLFCPSGIGNHVDHLATLVAVGRNYEELVLRYRIGFYEDLHYASRPDLRKDGLARLLGAFTRRTLCRHPWPLGDAAEIKLDLIRLYRSQFNRRPRSLEGFSPAAETPEGPHEAVWSEESLGPD